MNDKKINECLICYKDVQAKQLQIKFFCECKPIICISCYNKWYYENNYSCPICKKHDINLLSEEIKRQYKKTVKTYKEIIKENCTCKIDNLFIGNNFVIKSHLNKKSILLYKPILWMENSLIDLLIETFNKETKNINVINEIKKTLHEIKSRDIIIMTY